MATAEKDLPLVSNVNDISVKHYIFNFSCNFEERCFVCHAVLFLEPMIGVEMDKCECTQYDLNDIKGVHSSAFNLDVKTCPFGDIFMVILDCHKIIIDNVEEISMTCSEQENFKYARYNPVLFCTKRKLNFITDKWSLKIWKNSKTCKLCFPKFIRISYKTVSEGPSLLWVTDQDKKAWETYFLDDPRK